MTLVAHDGFSGTEFSALAGRTPDTVSGGGTWVTDATGLRLATGGTKVGNTTIGRSYLNDALNANQAAALDIHIRNADAPSCGVCVRYTTGATANYNFVGYFVGWTTSGVTLYELAGGSDNLLHWSSLGTATPSFTAGDTLYLEVVGSALVVKVNGSTVISTTDSAHSTGQVALYSGDGGDGFGDNYKTYQDTGEAAPSGGFTLTKVRPRPAAFRPGLAR